MKTLNKLFIAAIATMAMSACNNELSEQQANNSGIINFRMGIGTPASSRIAMADDNYSATFAAGDEVGIFVKDNDSYTNVKYTTADGTNWTGGPIKAPAEGAYNYTFYAYYPYSGEVTDASAITTTVATDQETNGYIKNDFLISTAETSNTTVTLPFSHALSLVEVLLTGDGAAEGATVSMLNVATDATIDLTTSTVTTGETKANVTMDALTGVAMKYRAIVPEQEISANTSIFKIEVNGKTYNASFATNVKFERGKYLAMIITLGKEEGPADIEISTGAEINDWTEGDGGDGTGEVVIEPVSSITVPITANDKLNLNVAGKYSTTNLLAMENEGWFSRYATDYGAELTFAENAVTIKMPSSGSTGWNNCSFGYHADGPFDGKYKFSCTISSAGNKQVAGGFSIRTSSDDRAITTEYTTNKVAGVRTIHSFTKKAVDGQQDDTASEQNISFTVDFSQKYDGGTSNQISSGLENTVTEDLTDIYIYIYNNTLDSEFSVSNIKLERITE